MKLLLETRRCWCSLDSLLATGKISTTRRSTASSSSFPLSSLSPATSKYFWFFESEWKYYWSSMGCHKNIGFSKFPELMSITCSRNKDLKSELGDCLAGVHQQSSHQTRVRRSANKVESYKPEIFIKIMKTFLFLCDKDTSDSFSSSPGSKNVLYSRAGIHHIMDSIHNHGNLVDLKNSLIFWNKLIIKGHNWSRDGAEGSKVDDRNVWSDSSSQHLCQPDHLRFLLLFRAQWCWRVENEQHYKKVKLS